MWNSLWRWSERLTTDQKGLHLNAYCAGGNSVRENYSSTCFVTIIWKQRNRRANSVDLPVLRIGICSVLSFLRKALGWRVRSRTTGHSSSCIDIHYVGVRTSCPDLYYPREDQLNSLVTQEPDDEVLLSQTPQGFMPPYNYTNLAVWYYCITIALSES